MRIVSILAAVVLVALTALALVPEVSAYHRELSVAAVAVAVVVLLALLATRSGKVETSAQATAPAASEPAAFPEVTNRADAEVVSFLATFQERGRLVDFLMDDITPYADAQVGAAARVVHEGCKAALIEHFGIRPVREEREGARVEVPAGFAADDYRLTGVISGEAPFTGTLVHRGWRAEWVKLPRALRTDDDRLPTIAPAEVDLK